MRRRFTSPTLSARGYGSVSSWRRPCPEPSIHPGDEHDKFLSCANGKEPSRFQIALLSASGLVAEGLGYLALEGHSHTLAPSDRSERLETRRVPQHRAPRHLVVAAQGRPAAVEISPSRIGAGLDPAT